MSLSNSARITNRVTAQHGLPAEHQQMPSSCVAHPSPGDSSPVWTPTPIVSAGHGPSGQPMPFNPWTVLSKGKTTKQNKTPAEITSEPAEARSPGTGWVGMFGDDPLQLMVFPSCQAGSDRVWGGCDTGFQCHPV